MDKIDLNVPPAANPEAEQAWLQALYKLLYTRVWSDPVRRQRWHLVMEALALAVITHSKIPDYALSWKLSE
jgi:hypothetical protein